MSQSLTLVNLDVAPWSAEYKLSETTYTISIPSGERREVIADEFKQAGTWQELGVASVANSQGGLAETNHSAISASVIMLFGGLCALSFWHTIKPHE